MDSDSEGNAEDVSRSRRTRIIQWAGSIATVFVLVVGVAFPPLFGLETDMQLVLTIFLMAIILWVTKPVPFTISSVLVMSLLFGLGITSSFDDAVSGFASELVFFLFLLILLGNTIGKTGLDDRAARQLLSAQSTPRRSVRSLSTNLFALSFFMPSAVARTVTFIPLVKRVTTLYGLGAKSNFEKSSFFILGHVNPIASMALMTGGGMAIITSSVIQSSVQSITWVEWAVYMIPPVGLLYAIAAVSAAKLYPVNDSMTIGDTQSTDGGETQSVDDELEADPMSRDERIVAVVMGATVVAWIVGSFVGIPTILPAVVAVVVLSLPGIQIITPSDIRSMSWGILFVIGAMFSILEVMETTGTLTFIVDTITHLVPFGTMALWQVVAILLTIAIVMRTFFSTASAAITVVLPIVLEFGSVLGINQLYLAFSILTIIGSTTFLPFNTTAVLVSFDQGPLSMRDVFTFGLLTMVFALAVIPLAWLFYWPFVDAIL
ncbi:SLC13 family permease [Salinadaptatus halalkaliphilus]|uniref:SLC13 family permease n=1 Tax=Salinadaptatus halalkaliphilus TaxID=2419781 RepID=A0A4V3VLK6_9EURY|nr:SLC13 family permease [Salinadaptatus halalkaliphilus]THE65967.1 SLC13 family permease [Salinadaptatus halalkaliphilus]